MANRSLKSPTNTTYPDSEYIKLSNEQQMPKQAWGPVLFVWFFTALIIQTTIWLTARVLESAEIINNDLGWRSAGILAFIWLFLRTWMKALTAHADR